MTRDRADADLRALEDKDGAKRRLGPLANMAMRGVSLAARFALTIYMTRTLGFTDLGVFGLLAGMAGITPAVLGFGVSYFVNRKLLELPPTPAYILLRNWWTWILAVAASLWLLGGVLMVLGILPPEKRLILPASIITLEYLAFDTHVALINLRQPIAANFLLFVRSASWIIPVIALGLIDTRFQSLDAILVSWLIALLINFALTAFVIRRAPWKAVFNTPIEWREIARMVRRGPLVYCNSLAATGQTYLERFIVAYMIGIQTAGIYTLYFSVTQGLYVLVATAVTQMAMPRLADALRQKGKAELGHALQTEAKRTARLAVPLVGLSLVVMLLLLPYLGFSTFSQQAPTLALMALTCLLKPFADLLSMELYLLGADRQLALANLAGVAFSVVLAGIGLHVFGLPGIGLSGVATQVMLIAARRMILARFAM